MEECIFVSAPKREANKILAHLLRIDLVRKDLKIRTSQDHVLIPVKNDDSKIKFEKGKGKFQRRELPVSPTDQVIRIMRSRGTELEVPPKFIRLGKALIFKDSRFKEWSEDLLSTVAEKFGVDTIYLDSGITSSVRREPSMKLLFGPGGDTIHTEGSIRYCLDPAKVMFSPGNVNVRIAKRGEAFDGKVILDMFAGIGYFSLHAASGSRKAKIYSCELNPVSLHYLEINIGMNSLGDIIIPIPGDCRKLPSNIIADHIIMGHFECLRFMSSALLHSKMGTTIDFHLLLDTNGINEGWYTVVKSALSFGFRLEYLGQDVVKSYGPHLWHVVTKMKVRDIPR